MHSSSDLMGVGDHAFGPEIFVADTDVLLGDACDVLEGGQRSELLRAIDAGSAIAVMSEKAFHELGRMSAKSARGRGVDPDVLRALIANEYLPRIPVVLTSAAHAEYWMPDASDMTSLDVNSTPSALSHHPTLNAWKHGSPAISSATRMRPWAPSLRNYTSTPALDGTSQYSFIPIPRSNL
jgi:hypothetical protein